MSFSFKDINEILEHFLKTLKIIASSIHYFIGLTSVYNYGTEKMNTLVPYYLILLELKTTEISMLQTVETKPFLLFYPKLSRI